MRRTAESRSCGEGGLRLYIDPRIPATWGGGRIDCDPRRTVEDVTVVSMKQLRDGMLAFMGSLKGS